jgi:hypothetical protein
MANRKTPEKDKKGTDLPELTAGLCPPTLNDRVDAILGSPEELIHQLADFPPEIKLSEFQKISQPVTDLELKTLCVLARAAIVPGQVDTILTCPLKTF